MPTVGCIDPFDVDQPASWDAYVERLKFFFEANGITDDGKKRATLLSVCGLPALSIAKSVVSPKSLSDVSYDYIVRALQCHFIPKPSVIYQRFHFQRRLQRDGEGIATYIAEFRRLASDCNFGSNLEERLRDQFVCGLKDEDLQKRLLAHSELDLNDALREAVAAESASRQAKDIRTQRTPKFRALTKSAREGINALQRPLALPCDAHVPVAVASTRGISASLGMLYADGVLVRATLKKYADRKEPTMVQPIRQIKGQRPKGRRPTPCGIGQVAP
ncbi:hypothetical protein M513_11039 [Trichuris suis]|uniref:Retrotransposon gag domain-containing protein n=1 Tax=Trichuris suis TaxID=68888 RepID=A0A085LT00_9BILA|nr:hypothetical protein M513_11039 [Trichuris suis]